MKKTFINLAVSAALCSGFGSLAYALDNPFVGANGYVNPDYAKSIQTFFADNPGNDPISGLNYKTKAQLLGVLDDAGNWKIPTAVWLDSIEAISGEENRSSSIDMYLKDALDKANQTGQPVVMTVVIYNLPGRDCFAYSSNGQLDVTELPKYKEKYIDEIAKRFAAFYSQAGVKDKVRLALVIEPDSLPNLITNLSDSKCRAAQTPYMEGVKYALSTFAGIKDANISMYLDIAHSGWLGWRDNANKVTSIYNNSEEIDPNTKIPKGLGAGFNAVRGFITNTSNYTPLKEAFTYDEYQPNYNPESKSRFIRTSQFYGYNLVYDESSFVAQLMSLQKSNGQLNLDMSDNERILAPTGESAFAGKHFLIDTSRNGWIPNSADYFAYKDPQTGYSYTRRDQRHHRGNWCNVQDVQPQINPPYEYDNPSKKVIPTLNTSPGFGELPGVTSIANPLYASGPLPIDALVWIKPPGESDGNFDPTKKEGTKERGDDMCGAQHLNGGSKNQYQKTDSAQGDGDSTPAPKAGAFFGRAFKHLVDASGCISEKFASQFCAGSVKK